MGQVPGTAGYAAPELIRHEPVDARTDVYALGCLLCEALTGSVPYPRRTQVEMWMAHLLDPPPAIAGTLSGLHSGVDDVLQRALAKDPADRFGSAGELARAAGEALREPRNPAPSAPEAAAAPRPSASPAPVPRPASQKPADRRPPAGSPSTKADPARAQWHAGDRYKAVLAENTSIFGPEHRITLAGRHDWAKRIGMTGDPAEAARLYRALATDFTHLHGPKHRSSLAARRQQAWWTWKAGDTGRAARLYQELRAYYRGSPRPRAPAHALVRDLPRVIRAPARIERVARS